MDTTNPMPVPAKGAVTYWEEQMLRLLCESLWKLNMGKRLCRLLQFTRGYMGGKRCCYDFCY